MHDNETEPLQDIDAVSQDTAPEGEAEAAQELDAVRAQLEQAQAELEKAHDSQLRERAELENQRRRMTNDRDKAVRLANEKLLGELLPVCDGLERGLAADDPDAASLAEGMQLTLKSLLKAMQDNGLEQIDPAGQAFDPEFHEAMQMVEPSDEQEPNSVVMVVEKGYVLNGRLLRPARVIVTRDA